MIQRYKRLIQLANENYVFFTHKNTTELNSLLKEQDANEVKDTDLIILDDLISILANTNNLYTDTRNKIIELQEAIRSRIYQS